MLNLASAGLNGAPITSWTIDWGDGSYSPGGQTISGDPSAVPHVYGSVGLYTISATASNGTLFSTSVNAGDAGAFDSSFASNFSGNDLSGESFEALALLPDGRIVAGGANGSGGAVLTVFNSAGTRDTSVSFASSGMAEIRAVAVEPTRRLCHRGGGGGQLGRLPHGGLCLGQRHAGDSVRGDGDAL